MGDDHWAPLLNDDESKVKTIRGAKTMAFDPKTGIIFSATVENVPPNATGPPNPKAVVYEPGPFVALVVEK